MREEGGRIRPTRSGLFAIELVAAVGVFTLCAAVCLGIFVQSEVMSQDSAALVRAVNEARSAAECFKAAGGGLDRTAALFGGQVQSDGGTASLVRTYDQDWNPVPEAGGTAYTGENSGVSPAGNSGTYPTGDGVFYRLELTPGLWPDAEEAGDGAAVEIPGCVPAVLRVTRSDGATVLRWETAAWEAAS